MQKMMAAAGDAYELRRPIMSPTRRSSCSGCGILRQARRRRRNRTHAVSQCCGLRMRSGVGARGSAFAEYSRRDRRLNTHNKIEPVIKRLSISEYMYRETSLCRERRHYIGFPYLHLLGLHVSTIMCICLMSLIDVSAQVYVQPSDRVQYTRNPSERAE